MKGPARSTIVTVVASSVFGLLGGFVGSEWFSNPPAGPQGEPGLMGPPGVQGDPGVTNWLPNAIVLVGGLDSCPGRMHPEFDQLQIGEPGPLGIGSYKLCSGTP